MKSARLSQTETVSAFETIGKPASHRLNLRLRGREFSSIHGIGESTALVRAIAERLVSRVPAPTKSDGGSAGQAKGLSFWIKNLELAFHSDRSVMIDCNSRGRHFFS